MKTILVILLAYLFGSIPWALVIGKVFYNVDIRTQGSGNLGGTNAGRVLGKKAGVSVTILDALKAFFAVLCAKYFAPDAMIFAGLACCVGHCFPIFANFRGGKAVATTYGYLLAISVFVTNNILLQFLFPIICFFVCLYFTKMVSLSSIVSLGIASLISLITSHNLTVTISIFVLWLFVTYRHKQNIVRIMNHEEKKITWM